MITISLKEVSSVVVWVASMLIVQRSIVAIIVLRDMVSMLV